MVEGVDFEVRGDGTTVWVNAADGSCVGRFSPNGLDLHRSATEQMAGAGECLDCSHGPVGEPEWRRFVDGLLAHHGIGLDEAAIRPGWLDGRR